MSAKFSTGHLINTTDNIAEALQPPSTGVGRASGPLPSGNSATARTQNAIFRPPRGRPKSRHSFMSGKRLLSGTAFRQREREFLVASGLSAFGGLAWDSRRSPRASESSRLAPIADLETIYSGASATIDQDPLSVRYILLRAAFHSSATSSSPGFAMPSRWFVSSDSSGNGLSVSALSYSHTVGRAALPGQRTSRI